MNQVDLYTFTISYDDRDSIYIGRVAEFRSLAAHGETAEEALNEIRYIVEDVIKDLEEEGAPVPSPRGRRAYSGKFVVRMPKSLHQTLVEEAENEGVSLNQLVVTRLANLNT